MLYADLVRPSSLRICERLCYQVITTGQGRHVAAQNGAVVTRHVENEIADQPNCWRRAAELAATAPGLPERGERVAVVGCGTSFFIAKAYAALREASGHGESDA